MNNIKNIKISIEVEEALKNNIGVVALESTIISHGMPYPKNFETAINCEKIIREEGCVPATIAIIKGTICVGLSRDEIEYIAREAGSVIKTSRRDIPVIVAKGLNGATTVAATAFIASLVGIKVFATGGIGGVHRGAEVSMDISCDLNELSLRNIAVVCAGAKAILDLGKTMEYLETFGVPVIGYKTEMLPAFYTKDSDFKVNYRMNSPMEIAKMLKAKWDLHIDGGVLITNPIPDEYSMDKDYINDAINKAIDKMNKEGIIGKDQTPFLLKTIVELTGGSSLESNIKLVYNNCHLAANIAKSYTEL